MALAVTGEMEKVEATEQMGQPTVAALAGAKVEPAGLAGLAVLGETGDTQHPAALAAPAVKVVAAVKAAQAEPVETAALAGAYYLGVVDLAVDMAALEEQEAQEELGSHTVALAGMVAMEAEVELADEMPRAAY